MIFSSYEFLLVFLPCSVAGFYWLRAHGASAFTLQHYLIVLSLAFYAYWSVTAAVIIAAVCLLNYVLTRFVLRHGAAKLWMTIGVCLSVIVLAYFKYVDFLIGEINGLLDLALPLTGTILPIGLSFVTFQQIAFIVDAYERKIQSVDDTSLTSYFLFIFFFPHAIAGPIVHHKEMVPQFAGLAGFKNMSQDFAIGLTLFVFGAAKKLLIADPLAGFVAPVFGAADAGLSPSGLEAWLAALAYTLQLYFDFSGYSDMAIGLARIFGIVLPVNFLSPYKSTNLIEFWRRWHITLSRFLRDYIYIRLGGNRRGAVRRHLNLLVTMAIGGFWHGANWTFLVWGLLHGAGLLVNHLFRAARPPHHADATVGPGRRIVNLLSWGATFMFVVVGWVFFRAETLAGAWRILTAMFVPDERFLPSRTLALMGYLGETLRDLGFVDNGTAFLHSPLEWALFGLPLLAVGLGIALLMPNLYEIMARFEPARLDSASRLIVPRPTAGRRLGWRPTVAWAAAVSAIAALVILRLGEVSPFLYYQF